MRCLGTLSRAQGSLVKHVFRDAMFQVVSQILLGVSRAKWDKSVFITCIRAACKFGVVGSISIPNDKVIAPKGTCKARKGTPGVTDQWTVLYRELKSLVFSVHEALIMHTLVKSLPAVPGSSSSPSHSKPEKGASNIFVDSVCVVDLGFKVIQT